MRADLQRLKRDTESGRLAGASSGSVVCNEGGSAAVWATARVDIRISSNFCPTVIGRVEVAQIRKASNRNLWKILVPTAVVVARLAGMFAWFSQPFPA
jgi:hypothetical protein